MLRGTTISISSKMGTRIYEMTKHGRIESSAEKSPYFNHGPQNLTSINRNGTSKSLADMTRRRHPTPLTDTDPIYTSQTRSSIPISLELRSKVQKVHPKQQLQTTKRKLKSKKRSQKRKLSPSR